MSRCSCIPAGSDRDYWAGSICEECERAQEGDERDALNEAHAAPGDEPEEA